MKNQKGFGVVGFVVLLPLILTILATISAAALVFKADAHLKHECRVSVLNSQRSAAQKLKDLMKLNPRATHLRREAETAQAALEAAQMTMVAPAIAIAEGYVFVVRAQRLALAIQQKSLIVQGKAYSYAAPLKARGAVMRGLAEEARANVASVPSAQTVSSRMGRFNVKATPENDITPDYNPADTFTKDQIVDLDVSVDVASLLPEWLRKLLPTGGLQIKSHCQATIEKQENAWVETLNTVK